MGARLEFGQVSLVSASPKRPRFGRATVGGGVDLGVNTLRRHWRSARGWPSLADAKPFRASSANLGDVRHHHGSPAPRGFKSHVVSRFDPSQHL